jgi:mRNA interferase MazF
MANSPPRQERKVAFPRRGEIYLVHFDPTLGHEIQKTRPALVLQNGVSNQYSQITIVAAINLQFAEPPIEPADSGLPRRSAVIVNQIRSIDRQRLGKRIGHLFQQDMERVDDSVEISLGLIEF